MTLGDFGIKNNPYLKRTMCAAIFAVTNKPITAFNQLRLEQKQTAISGGGGGGSSNVGSAKSLKQLKLEQAWSY
jgi:hypothetical protein